MFRHGVTLILLALASQAVWSAERPNIVLILADDLGWTDLGVYGSDYYLTPELDRLARDGMQFTSNYSACTVCSPTRAALLTGKYPARLHITDWIPGLPPENPQLLVPEFTKFLPHDEVTLAEILKKAGYATASIGKWHLGEEKYYPETHGFDVNVAGTDAPQPKPGYFAPYDIPTLAPGPDGEYITDRLTQEAESFVRKHASQPFFLYLPHFAVHTPIQAKQDLMARHQERINPQSRHQNAGYAGMLESLDQSIGRLRRTLDELKLAERTIAIFTSDNGGRIPTTSNAPLRAGKGSCYEGGVRVPLLVSWPKQTRPSSICDDPVTTVDLFPTILEMLGLTDEANQRRDGLSLVGLLKGSGKLPERPLFWHYPHYQHYQLEGTTPYGAIRRGDYKLIEFYNDQRVELYDVRQDIGEKHDLAAKQPERVAALRGELHAWRKEVGAQMPTRNPNYDPRRPEHVPKKKKAQKG